jgi:hypothetical protein
VPALPVLVPPVPALLVLPVLMPPLPPVPVLPAPPVPVLCGLEHAPTPMSNVASATIEE